MGIFAFLILLPLAISRVEAVNLDYKAILEHMELQRVSVDDARTRCGELLSTVNTAYIPQKIPERQIPLPRVPAPIKPVKTFADEGGFQLWQIRNVEVLSGRGVVRLDLADGRRLVVRSAQQMEADPQFESFAGAVMRTAPGIHVSPVQVLSDQASQKLKSVLQQDPRVLHYTQLQPPFSLTEYTPGARGDDALRYFGIDDPNPGNDESIAALLRNMQRVPLNMRRQLSDLWVLYRMLGIWDFHFENWIHSSDGKVHGIDFAFRSPWFDAGINIPEESLMYPYANSAADLYPGIARALLRSVTPEILQYLQDLRPEAIQAISDASGFSLTPQALQGIELRRRTLLGEIQLAQ